MCVAMMLGLPACVDHDHVLYEGEDGNHLVCSVIAGVIEDCQVVPRQQTSPPIPIRKGG